MFLDQISETEALFEECKYFNLKPGTDDPHPMNLIDFYSGCQSLMFSIDTLGKETEVEAELDAG